MKRQNIPVYQDLYQELKNVADNYHSTITKLAAAAISFALRHPLTVWGFAKVKKENRHES